MDILISHGKKYLQINFFTIIFTLLHTSKKIF